MHIDKMNHAFSFPSTILRIIKDTFINKTVLSLKKFLECFPVGMHLREQENDSHIGFQKSKYLIVWDYSVLSSTLFPGSIGFPELI